MLNLLFSFDGRVNRARFWLVHIGVAVAQSLIFGAVVGEAIIAGDHMAVREAVGTGTAFVLLIVSIAFVCISLAVGVKRFHDRGKSGWWVLILLVPVIGFPWYLIECGFLPGTAGPNAYGPDPLAAG
jgi:uncharacterized membrane protein YhaH (DUF805 family)